MDNDFSAFSKGRMLYQCITRCTRLDNRSRLTENSQLLKREFLKVHNTKYLSVKCAVLMHLSFTCITHMIDLGVVCLSTILHVSNIKCDGSWVMSHGYGSHIRWVSGSWVNSNDPLPALVCVFRCLSMCPVCVCFDVCLCVCVCV